MRFIYSLALCMIGLTSFVILLAKPERITFWEDLDQVDLLQETRIVHEKEHIPNLEDLREYTNEQLKDLAASI